MFFVNYEKSILLNHRNPCLYSISPIDILYAYIYEMVK